MKFIKKVSRNIVKIVMIFVIIMGSFAIDAYAVPITDGPVTLYVGLGGLGDTPRVEGAIYSNLGAAIGRASNGDTIKLLNDSTSIAGIILYKSIILDLNGKKLTSNSTTAPLIDMWFRDGSTGNLDIIDSSDAKNGVMSNRNYVIRNQHGGGSIKIHGGTIHSNQEAAIYANSGNIEVLGGTVTSNGETSNTIFLLDSCSFSISSGTVSAAQRNAIGILGYGDINVSGGTISAKNYPISAFVGSGQSRNLTITGGNITSTTAGIAIHDLYSNVRISSGVFKGNFAVRKLKISGNPTGNPIFRIDVGLLVNDIFEIDGPLTVENQSIIVNGGDLWRLPEGGIVATATSEEYVNASQFKLINLPGKTLVKNGLNLVLANIPPEPSNNEKINLAKTAIELALENLVVSNTTTATDVLNAAKQAALHGVSVEWDINNNFNKVNATSLTEGLITGTFKLSLNNVNESVIVNKTIAKLESDPVTPITDSTKIAEAKTAIELALENLVVSNTTTATDVLNAAKQAVLHGVSVEWDSTKNFNKVDATNLATGLITGIIKLSLNESNVEITLGKVINQLPSNGTETKELLINTPTGVKVEGINGVGFHFDTELVVTPVMETLEKEKLNGFALNVSNLESELEIAQIYMIKLMLNGVAVQPNGMVKVTLPLTEQQKGYSNLQIVHIDDDGVVTRVLSTMKDNQITFMTDHFSYYSIVGTSANEVLPETSDSSNSLVWWIMLLGSLLVVVSGRKKNRYNQ